MLTSSPALVEGATLAVTLGQSGSTYSSVAPQILCFLQRFWVSGGYIDSNSKSTSTICFDEARY